MNWLSDLPRAGAGRVASVQIFSITAAKISIETVRPSTEISSLITGGMVMNLYSIVANWFRQPVTRQTAHRPNTAWLNDPLSHPALGAMSERELGDMPFRLSAYRTDFELCRMPGCGS
jgi:hypothetical protein